MDFDRAYFGVGTGSEREGVFRAVGVVFLVGDLVCPELWRCDFVSDVKLAGKRDEYLDIWYRFLRIEDLFYPLLKDGGD